MRFFSDCKVQNLSSFYTLQCSRYFTKKQKNLNCSLCNRKARFPWANAKVVARFSLNYFSPSFIFFAQIKFPSMTQKIKKLPAKLMKCAEISKKRRVEERKVAFTKKPVCEFRSFFLFPFPDDVVVASVFCYLENWEQRRILRKISSSLQQQLQFI